MRPLIHGATYFAELYERIEATRAGDLVLLHRLAGRRRRAAHRRAGQRGGRGPRPCRRARRRRPRAGLAVALRGDGVHLAGEPAPRPGPAAPWRRGDPGHAGAHRRLPPPEDGRDPPPRRPDPRHRLRRRHRPLPLPPRRRRPPRRPAGAGEPGPGVRRHPAVARHPGRDHRARRPRRRDGVPRAVGGPDHAAPQPGRPPARPAARASTRCPTRCPRRRRRHRPVAGGRHVVQLLRTYPNLRRGRDYAFARGGERSVARGYTKAVRAGPAPRLRRGPVPLGRPRRRASSPRRCAPTPTCT